MKKAKEKETKTEEITRETELSSDIQLDFTDAETQKKSDMTTGFKWTDREELFYGIYKGEDEKGSSNYSTGELQGLVLDSACRVMAQMPTGKFKNINVEDVAKAIASTLLYHEVIIPNANTGGDFFTKQRQANLYSKVYGKMPAFIDYVEGEDYSGPDLVLVHPRRFFPQPGKYSIHDMDWCFVTTFVTKQWLQDRAKASPKIWNKDVIDALELAGVDQNLLTAEEKNNEQKRKSIVIVHRFTKEGDWVIFEKESKKIIVDEKDCWPGIPMVEKRTIPVLDRYWDLCDYERGETPQKAIDALVRNYLRAVDKSIDPTTIIDPKGMVMSSVNEENKFWFAKDGKTREPRVLENAPRGLATFQSTYNIMKANLMSLSASTDTSVGSGSDVGFGKTPEALKMQGEREGARDSWDRYMQERFLEDTANMMLKVASKRGMSGIKIEEIGPAIEKIKSAYPQESLEQFKGGEISDELIQDLKIKYEVDEGSTAKKSDAGEKVMLFLEKISENQAIMDSFEEENKKINWGEVVKRMAIDNGIQDWDKIVTVKDDPQAIDGIGDEDKTLEEEIPPLETEQQVIPQA